MSHDAITRPSRIAPASSSDETLVADARNGVTPAQMVQRRFMSLLHGTPLPPVREETFKPRSPLSYEGA